MYELELINSDSALCIHSSTRGGLAYFLVLKLFQSFAMCQIYFLTLVKMGHGAGHGRKKKKSIVRKLAQASVTRLIPNTYSRRMTRYSAYDADAVTVRVRSQMIDIFQYFYIRLSLC